MIAEDKKEEYEKELTLTEYLASFWNSEAVQKVRETRASRESHAFKADAEFEKSILTDEYKSSPLLEAVKKLKQMEQEEEMASAYNNPNRRRKSKAKEPTNLSELSRIIKKF
jgi:hypothetical protein